MVLAMKALNGDSRLNGNRYLWSQWQSRATT